MTLHRVGKYSFLHLRPVLEQFLNNLLQGKISAKEDLLQLT